MAESGCKNLAVSMVVHQWCDNQLRKTLGALAESLDTARKQGQLDAAKLFVIYNGAEPLDENLRTRELTCYFHWAVEVLPAQVNEGYGKANNLLLINPAVARGFDAALVMNPDVDLDLSTISKMLVRLSEDPANGLIVPRLLEPTTGCDLYGCKRYPSLAVLAGRQFRVLLRIRALQQLNANYEYRDRNPRQAYRGVELCSGCFLLATMKFWRDVGGFDERYFMYFEDFDLSVRAANRGWVHVYEPDALVRHAGGGTARKSLQHRYWFVCSAMRFFIAHGWRLWRVGRA